MIFPHLIGLMFQMVFIIRSNGGGVVFAIANVTLLMWVGIHLFTIFAGYSLYWSVFHAKSREIVVFPFRIPLDDCSISKINEWYFYIWLSWNGRNTNWIWLRVSVWRALDRCLCLITGTGEAQDEQRRSIGWFALKIGFDEPCGSHDHLLNAIPRRAP